jgi:hypothetical protein
MNDERIDDDQELERGLTADLGALRAALRDVRAPESDERRLVAALQARRTLQESTNRDAQPLADVAPGAPRAARRRAWRLPLAIAAAAALAAVAAVLTLRVGQGGDVVPLVATESSAPGAPPAPQQGFAGAFQPLAFSSGLSSSRSYSVVRVRIPLAALTPGHSVPPDATVEADLLVGEDGLASGIRFNKEDTLFVSTVSQSGERR